MPFARVHTIWGIISNACGRVAASCPCRAASCILRPAHSAYLPPALRRLLPESVSFFLDFPKTSLSAFCDFFLEVVARRRRISCGLCISFLDVHVSPACRFVALALPSVSCPLLVPSGPQRCHGWSVATPGEAEKELVDARWLACLSCLEPRRFVLLAPLSKAERIGAARYMRMCQSMPRYTAACVEPASNVFFFIFLFCSPVLFLSLSLVVHSHGACGVAWLVEPGSQGRLCLFFYFCPHLCMSQAKNSAKERGRHRDTSNISISRSHYFWSTLCFELQNGRGRPVDNGTGRFCLCLHFIHKPFSWFCPPCACLLPLLPCLVHVAFCRFVLLHWPCMRPCRWKERCGIGACRPFLCSFCVDLEMLLLPLVQRSFLSFTGVLTCKMLSSIADREEGTKGCF